MHPHSIEVALQGGPVPPRFISIKWGGTSAPPEFTGGFFYHVHSFFCTEEFIFTYFDLASDVASKITILRVLRMARIVRLMQLLRKTRSLKELQKLVHRQNPRVLRLLDDAISWISIMYQLVWIMSIWMML